MKGSLDATKFRADEFFSILAHLPDGLNFFLLVLKHLECLIYPKSDGIRWITHVVHCHIEESLVVFQLVVQFGDLLHVEIHFHFFEWAELTQ